MMKANLLTPLLTFLALGTGVAVLVVAARHAGWSEKNLDRTRESGQVIVGQILDFRQKNGRYPLDLAEIKRFTKSELSPPYVGSGEWIYGLENGLEGFYLQAADEGGYPTIIYYHSSRSWIVDM
jgi:hypothetical protein